MAAYAFLPELWSKEVSFRLKNLLVGEQICNTQYQGEIAAMGDRVNVWTPGAVTALTYTKNTGFSASIETTDDTEEYIDITSTAGFHFYVDAINKVQGAIDPLGPYLQEAAYTVANTIDAAIMAQYANVHANNIAYPAAAISGSTIYDVCNELHRRLSDSKAPLNDRFLVVSPRVMEAMNASISTRTTALGDQAVANGYVGDFAGFKIYLSHNVVATTGAGTGSGTGSNVVHKCLAGVLSGISLAYSIKPNMIVAYTPEAKMGTAVKGLALYGIKMWKAGALNGVLNAWWAS